MLVRLLTYFRDARWVWDLTGSIYNRRIYGAIAELYDHIARDNGAGCPGKHPGCGCRPGLCFPFDGRAKSSAATIVGIDYSSMQVREADALRKQRRIANCQFRRGDAMQIMSGDESFDDVVSVGSIKHWPDGLRGTHRNTPGPETRRMGCHLRNRPGTYRTRPYGIFVKRFPIWFLP